MESKTCILCKSEKIGQYLSSKKISQCLRCGLVFLEKNQTEKDLDLYYENNVFYAQNNKNQILKKEMLLSANFYLKIITRFIKPKASLIDVGSNSGTLIEEAEKMGFEAVGLEKNKYLVEDCQKRNLRVFNTTVSELSLSKPVDIVTAMHVLEHMPDPKSFIKETWQILAPKGFLFLGVPNIESFLARKDGLSWKYIALEHIYYFSPKTITKLLTEEGFEVIKIFKDKTNLQNLGIKKIFHYLYGKPLIQDRLVPKNYKNRNHTIPPSNLLKKMLKLFLILMIKILGREDFILIVARKNNKT